MTAVGAEGAYERAGRVATHRARAARIAELRELAELDVLRMWAGFAEHAPR